MAHTKPTYLNFDDKNYAWKPDIDYRVEPFTYRVGKGEQGVLICEPYKTEIGQYWRFKTKEIADKSSKKIYALFMKYVKDDDFVGADMARKYLQMGYTRARRYANYKGGKKYDANNNYAMLEKGTGDLEKAASADIFTNIGSWLKRMNYTPNAKRIGKMKGVKKENLPHKLCVTCGRPFTWRKKWEKVWQEVKYCSEKCKRQKTK